MPDTSLRSDTPGTLGTPAYSAVPNAGLAPLTVTAGHGGADIPGDSNLCLQAAVDYVAGLGGGVVSVLPGRYTMHDSLHLRPNVIVRGSGEDTVLVKAPMVASKLSVPFLGYGHWDVSLAEPDLFRTGMGIHVGGPGFHGTCATLTFRTGDRFGISRPLNDDTSAETVVRSVFPVISGYGAHDCVVESIRIEGDAAHNGYIDGCRGGGVFLLDCDLAIVRGVTVEGYNGDGFSFQQSNDIVLEECVARANRGHGFHPGSGSSRFRMSRVVAEGNGMDGVFYCLRANHGLLEDSRIADSGDNGISIGQRDADNTIRNCAINGSRHSGVYFRPVGDASLVPVNTLIEGCSIQGNARESGAEVYFADLTRDVAVRGCPIGPGPSPGDHWAGLLFEPGAGSVTLEGNSLEGPDGRAIVDRRTAWSLAHGGYLGSVKGSRAERSSVPNRPEVQAK